MKEAVLSDYVTLQRGTTYKSSLLGQPGPILLGLASIQQDGGFRRDSLKTYGGESPEKLILRPGDVYVSLKDVTQSGDLLGSVSRVPKEIKTGRVTQDTVKLLFRNPETPKNYIYWLLRTPQYRAYCRARATGTTNLALSREDFLAYPVPEPTYNRLYLARILDLIEEKIELNRQMNETLETIANSLFKSWFVNFDPTCAKSEGRQPAAMDVETAALFPDRFETIEGRKVPMGWRVRSIYDVADVIYGAPFSSNHFNIEKRGLPLIRIRDLSTHDPKVSTDENQPRAEKILPGDILVGMDGEFKINVWTGPESWLNQRLCKFIPKFPKSTLFLKYSLEVPVNFFETSKVGTTIIHLGKSDIDTFKIVIPSTKICKKFCEISDPISQKIVVNAIQSRTLASIRDTLLPKLISGEIKIIDEDSTTENFV